MDNMIAPFDEETQNDLKEMDVACAIQIKQLREKAAQASLAGVPYEIDVETMVWMKVIKSFGILYNRAIDAGWIDGVHMETVV